jgi:hypothetical protein
LYVFIGSLISRSAAHVAAAGLDEWRGAIFTARACLTLPMGRRGVSHVHTPDPKISLALCHFSKSASAKHIDL